MSGTRRCAGRHALPRADGLLSYRSDSARRKEDLGFEFLLDSDPFCLHFFQSFRGCLRCHPFAQTFDDRDLVPGVGRIKDCCFTQWSLPGQTDSSLVFGVTREACEITHAQ